MLRLLTISSLFPNIVQPTHGVFVEERLRHLVATGSVSACVLAPVPWLPPVLPRGGRYAEFRAVPPFERRYGIDVFHPRYLVLPKIGMRMASDLLELGLLRVARELVRRKGCELIDAHYLYPDGVAAARVAARLGLPYVLTARGSDVNLIGQIDWCRRRMMQAVQGAAVTMTMSEALRSRLLEWGVPAERVVVVRNGVDFERFAPRPADALRRKLLPHGGRMLLSVGKLDENKGHRLVIQALREMPDTMLVIAGEGPLRNRLLRVAGEAGVADRLRLAGVVAHDRLAELYCAADVVVQASAREGLPNVILESLACGTPVVATRVGGIPEVLDRPVLGELIEARTPAAIASAIERLWQRPRDRAAVREAASRFDWRASTEMLRSELARAAGMRAEGRHTSARASGL